MSNQNTVGSPPAKDEPGAPGQSATAPSRPNRSALTLTVIVTCYLMVAIDSTIVNIALPSIQKALGFSPVGLSWVINAYLLAFGGLLLLGGRMGDMFGRRRVLVVGTVIFTVSSLLGGIADTPWLLVTARALQGVGAAMAAPGTLALIAGNFEEGAPRNRALSIYSATAATGTSLGLILGGILTSLASWRWIQFVNVPIGLAVAVLAPMCIRETPAHSGRFDFAGTVSGTAGVTALVYGLIRVPSEGWGNGVSLACFAAAVVLLVSFLPAERRAAQPIVPLQLFSERTRTAAYTSMLMFTATILSLFYFLSQFIQDVLEFSPIQAGLAFLPMTLGMFVVARAVPRMLPRHGAKRFMVVGALLMTVTAIWLSTISVSDSYLTGVLGPMLLFGIGAGCCLMPTNVTVLSGVPQQLAGAASGVLQTMMQLGGALGLAILVTVYGTSADDAARHAGTGADAVHKVVTEGVRSAFTGSIVFVGCALAVALLVIRVPEPPAEA
ncbi:MFS transporter [Streptomyces argyrophyllae]|uniref:MFS transporter n=1 Tax=Streptomyces argyrophylli TaxID=2726118 RepID=A0A6M4PRZ3_9ACTN|nr:MFS transporter [Streptomyces argyrophyllae]QJS13409.1 MFS transporter [Streptomyces argyrophyllae]